MLGSQDLSFGVRDIFYDTHLMSSALNLKTLGNKINIFWGRKSKRRHKKGTN